MSVPPSARPPRGLADLLGFLAFSHAWTWAFWGLAGALGESVWAWPEVAFFYVGGAGVPLGAVVMSRSRYGWSGTVELGRRIIDTRRVPARWWAVILLLFPALTVGASIIAVATGASLRPLDLAEASAQLQQPGSFLAFVFFILLIGPLPEEIGWRGYLLDRLQLRWNALVASLVLGLIWWSWHLPLFALPGYFDAFGRTSPTVWDFLYGIVPIAIVYTWVYNNTHRSILAVIVLHFMQNFTGEFLGVDETVRPIRLLLEAGVAVAVVVWWGPGTLRGRRPLDPLPNGAGARMRLLHRSIASRTGIGRPHPDGTTAG